MRLSYQLHPFCYTPAYVGQGSALSIACLPRQAKFGLEQLTPEANLLQWAGKQSYVLANSIIRDWSLFTGRGGYKTGGGACEVFPLRKGGAEKVLAMLKGGTNSFGVVFTR